MAAVSDAALTSRGRARVSVSGRFAVWFLVNYLKRRSLIPFVIYRLVLAAVIAAVWYR